MVEECSLGLDGLRALVTSSSRGLGYGVASVLVSCGARVYVAGRTRESGLRAAERLGPSACGGGADLSVEGSAALLVGEAARCLGGLDALVYVPPPPPGGGVLEVPFEAWRLSYRLLVEAPIESVRAFLEVYDGSRPGSIVFVTSVAAWEPLPAIATSSVLRPSLHALTVLLARELADRGIRVNAVVPGYYDTNRLREAVRLRAERSGSSFEEELGRLSSEIPLGRPGRPEELGWAVAFLLSPRAGYITGAVLAATGGLHRSVR